MKSQSSQPLDVIAATSEGQYTIVARRAATIERSQPRHPEYSYRAIPGFPGVAAGATATVQDRIGLMTH